MPPVFDALAADYDAEFSDTLVGRSQRSEVWYYLQKHLPPTPATVLELNCGTGIDAAHLSALGYELTATDVSEKMIEVARKKHAKPGFRVLDACDLDKEDRQYNILFSNFGGLNFLAPEAMKKLAADAGKIVSKGGLVVIVMIHKWCFWELMYFFIRFRWKTAFRRIKGRAEFKGAPVYYYSDAEMRSFFSDFRLEAAYPIGVLTPPSYDEKVLRWLGNKPRIQKTERKPERFISRIIGSDHRMYVWRKG